MTEILDEILFKLEYAGRWGANPLGTPDDDRDEAKQAILDWHNKQIAKERIYALEYAKISPKFKIEEKIEQLRLEAEL